MIKARRTRGTAFALAAMIVLALVPIGGGVATSAGAATAVAAADATGIIPAATPVPNSYIVTLKDPGSVAVAAKAREVEDSGGTVERVYTHALAGFSATMSRARVADLAQDPSVLRVEENSIVTLADTQALQYPPAFPAGTDSWGLDRIDQRDLPLDLAYTSPSTAASVHAYVIDTGILPTHTDFGGRASIGNDFVGDGKNGIDCEGHGTHVAGTLGGTRYGVAKSVDLVAVRVLNCNGSGTTAQVISGIDWVTANAVKPAVATLSLAAGLSSSLDDAVRNSIGSGVTYVVAAGNKSANECSTTSPSGVAEAITAAASTITDAQSSFSDFGPCIDLYAPGSSITSDWFTGTTATHVLSGTSMATPHVAGAAALFLASCPAASPAQVSAALADAATTGKVSGAGAGSPNRLLYTGLIGPSSTSGTGPCPPGLSVTPGDGVVHLSWTMPPDNGSAITGYNVYRSTTAGAETLLPNMPLASDATGSDDTAVTNGTTYFYRVSAINGAGEGTLSLERQALPATVPDAVVLNASAAPSVVHLTWAPPASGGTPITSYRVYRALSPGAEGVVAFATTSSPSFDDTSVTNGTTYYYRVSAVNAVGEGAASTEQSATPLGPPGRPSLVATAGHSVVHLSWSVPADGGSPITGYNVYRSTTSGAETLLTGVPLAPAPTTFDDTTVVDGVTYFYNVSAVNAVDEGPLAIEKSATPASPAFVFVRGGDDGLYVQRFNGSAWSGFTPLGGTLASDPAPVYDGTNLWVFVRGADNALYVKRSNGTAWPSGFTNLGGVVASSPTTVFDGTHVWVFVRGSDNGLYAGSFLSGSPSSWTGFTPLGGVVVGDPSAVAVGNSVWVFVRGADNRVYVNTHGASWSGFGSLGGIVTSSPSAVRTPTGVLATVRGLDNGLYVATFTGTTVGSFIGFAADGGILSSDPVTAGAAQQAWALVRGGDDGIYVGTITAWQGYKPLGGATRSAVGGVAEGTSLLVLAAGIDDSLWWGRTNGTTWTGWSGLGGVLRSPPAVTAGP